MKRERVRFVKKRTPSRGKNSQRSIHFSKRLGGRKAKNIQQVGARKGREPTALQRNLRAARSHHREGVSRNSEKGTLGREMIPREGKVGENLEGDKS